MAYQDAHHAGRRSRSWSSAGLLPRWLASTNHKDIGTLYLCLAIFAGVIGGALSVVMRAQLMHPGNELITDHQFYNVLITRARPDHGVFRGHAGDLRRVRQLDGALDDRRAGHGLPAAMNNVSFWLLIPSFLLLVSSASWAPAMGSTAPGPGSAGRSIRRFPQAVLPAIPVPRSTWRSSRCTSPAPRRS